MVKIFGRSFALRSLLLATLIAAPAWAQQYPARTVRIVVPFAPGGTADTLGRIVAVKLTESLGQSFVAENRPGAGGLLGSDLVAKSAPDGYTLVVSGVASHAIAPALSAKPPFDPVKDFAGITRLGSAPLFLITNPDTPVKTLKEVVDLAKKEPGKLNFSSPGLASTTFIAGAQFRRIAGINIVHVPFRSAPDAVTAVIRGDAQFYFAPSNLARDQSEAGKVRAIAAAMALTLPASA